MPIDQLKSIRRMFIQQAFLPLLMGFSTLLPCDTSAAADSGRRSSHPLASSWNAEPEESPQIYRPLEIDDVFSRKSSKKTSFLPASAYEPGPIRIPTEVTELPEGPYYQVQYPFEEAATRDKGPYGHYDEPRWNPFPGISLPDTGERGFELAEAGSTVTVLPGSGGNLGITSMDFRAKGTFKQAPFIQITPRFSSHFLDGPSTVDLPGQMYDFAVETTLYIPLQEGWALYGGIAPGMFSDFDNTSSDAFRIVGGAMLLYDYSPQIKISGGFMYLDRDDIIALPAGGVVYTPNENVKLEFTFPRPKMGYRIRHNEERTQWIYLAGELGGGSWAIERAAGFQDVVSYRDYRLIAGFEHIRSDYYRFLIEAGYIFNREIEYTSNIGNTDQSPTGMIRAGIAF